MEHEAVYHAEAQQRGVALRIAGTLLGGALILNAFFADALFPEAQGIGSISAFFGALLLGIPVVWTAVKDILSGELRMTELVALAMIACFALQDYKTAGVVAFLLLMADLVQRRTALGAHASIESLIRLTPTQAHVVGKDGSETEVETAALRTDMIFRLRPGDNIPADGIIISGSTTVNEATITGEALPADKGTDDVVFAGTMNLTGTADVRVSKAGTDTTLGQVRKLILTAETTKIPIMRLIDRYIQWYTPAVIMIAGIILFFTKDMNRAITTLVVTCPAAIILATPTAIIAALSSAARLGILVKNVGDLEAASGTNAVVFDKTGTLTTGELSVTRLFPLAGVEPASLLAMAAAVARRSNHPASKAVVQVANEAKLKLAEPEDFEEVAGKGVYGVVDGHKVALGRESWLRELDVDMGAVGESALAAAESLSTLFVAQDGRCIGVVGLEDKTRPDARHATDELKDMGIRNLTLLTGDRWGVAKKVGKELGCTNIEAECLPEHKLELVEQMKKQGYHVMVVGDGVNDAPALAAGDLGVAMGAAGSDIAIHSADVALMSNDLRRLPMLIKLSKRSRRVIFENLFFGILFIVGGLVLSGFGKLTPITAAILYNVGSLFVIFNSARLVRFREEVAPAATA